MSRRVWLYRGIAALALCLLLSSSPLTAQAASILVTTSVDALDNDGKCSLREAIIAANTDAPVDACSPGNGPDTIILPAGFYALSIPGQNEDAAMSGDLDITAELSIMGDGENATIVDGNQLDRVFDLGVAGPTVTLMRLTVQNGNSGPNVFGGGIRNLNGALTLTNVVLTNNTAPTVPGAGTGGGALFNGGSLTLLRTQVVSNHANVGGGIYNDTHGQLQIETSVVASNTADFEAGAIFNGGSAQVRTSTISENSAYWGAGGISNTSTGEFVLEQSSVISNRVEQGAGGGAANSGRLSVVNTTFFRNEATEARGGGIANSSMLNLTNSTFAENSAFEFGAALFNDSGTARLVNTIVANSFGTLNCGGSFVDGGGNLRYPLTDSTCVGAFGDPRLGALQNHGGPTDTLALLPGSQAIDAGLDAACPPVDQRGVARPQDGNGDGIARCDIGAYEREGAVSPTSTPTPTVVRVSVDIKPGNSPNAINLKSKGVIPVAILSTASFDARAIDFKSICFGDAEDISERDCSEAHAKAHREDVNGDSLVDLVLHFETQQSGIDTGDTQACVSGKTLQGTAILGCDAILTKP